MKEALKLAQSTLQSAMRGNCDHAWFIETLAKIEEALAQPAQEPDIYPEEARDMGLEAVAYYTTPPAAPQKGDATCKE